MRGRVLVSLCLALLLLGTPVLGASQPAPQPAAESQQQPVSLVSFDFPKQVTAGQTVTFKLTLKAEQEGGVCCGSISLKGPSDQYALVDLARTGPGTLTGSLRLSPHAQPGTWTIQRLTVRTNT
mgnify:CR=1 FL=1